MPAVKAPWRFWAIAYALLILVTGTNLPTPLYRGLRGKVRVLPAGRDADLRRVRGDADPVPAGGRSLADAVGRRRVLQPSLAVAALGSLSFALAAGTAWLFAARILQGIAVGSASGALTAALTELHAAGDRRKAALVSAVTSMGGLGLGPVLAGLIAQYGPAPRVLPFIMEIVLLTPAAAAIATLPAARPAARWQPRRAQIPAEVRGIFAATGLACFLAFAVIGLFLTLIPAYVASLSGSTNLLLAGSAVALVLACSVLAQLAGYRRPARYLQRHGLLLLATGLLLLAVAGAISSLALLLIAATAAGTGQGLVFLGGLAAVNQAAPEGRRADVLSSFYVVIYLGVGLPVIGVGFLATTVSLLRAVQYFAGAAALLCLLVLILPARARRKIPGAAAPPARREALADCRGRSG